MKFVRGIKKIEINNEHEISTIQYFDEDEDRVTLEVVEYVPYFKRGFVCDMDCEFLVLDNDGKEDVFKTKIRDLVLVHIRKSMSIDSFPTISYVFYK